MTSYRPPTANYPLFDPSVFDVSTTALTQEDGDERYVRFPVAQGAQTFPANVTMQGVSTIGNATFTDANPAYEIKYPVNSGRIDFYSNTAGGVSTRGLKVDATGVHTISKYDTIDETAGTLDIGTLVGRTGTIQIGGATGTGAGRTINIGTTSGSGTNTLNIGGSTINVGSANTSILQVNPDSGSALRLGSNMTAGSIVIGGTTGGSTAISIGNGASQSGAIQIGTGTTNAKDITIGTGSGGTTLLRGSNTTIDIGSSGTLTLNSGTSGTVNIGTAMTSGTINIGRPLLPAYTGTTPASTEIGYKVDIAGLVLATNYPIATGNITTSAFSIPNGVWLVNIVIKVNFASALSGAVYLRVSLSTVSGTSQDARTIDFNPNDTGNNFLNYTTTIANASATNYFLVGASGGTPNPTITSTIVNITRIA
jgi:hypothetical protein